MSQQHTRLEPTPRTEVIATHPPSTAAAARLVTRTSLVALAADLALMAVIGEVIAPLAVFAVLTVGAIVGLRRHVRAKVTTLAVLGLVANVAGVPFWTQDLLHPAEVIAFLWAVLSAGGRFVAIVGAVLTRRGAPGRHTRMVTAGAVGLAAVALVTSVVARASVTTDELVAGDVEADIEDTAFPSTIAVDRGGAIHLDNLDPYRHTFTVEGSDVNVDLPGGVARRVAIDLPPGTYAVVCEVPGHESMTSTLEVR